MRFLVKSSFARGEEVALFVYNHSIDLEDIENLMLHNYRVLYRHPKDVSICSFLFLLKQQDEWKNIVFT